MLYKSIEICPCCLTGLAGPSSHNVTRVASLIKGVFDGSVIRAVILAVLKAGLMVCIMLLDSKTIRNWECRSSDSQEADSLYIRRKLHYGKLKG